jgi:hypothetical protein
MKYNNLLSNLGFVEAIQLMESLIQKTNDVGVFLNKGWGDSSLEITIIINGDGQNPLASINYDTYTKLLDSKIIGPNCLQTFKARKFHPFVGEGI